MAPNVDRGAFAVVGNFYSILPPFPKLAYHPSCGSSIPLGPHFLDAGNSHRAPYCPICHLLHPHPALPRLTSPTPTPPHPSMLSVGWALSLNFPLQWQAVSPSEKTPDLKRALRTLLSKMKVMSTVPITLHKTHNCEHRGSGVCSHT